MSKGLKALERIGKQKTKDTSFGIDIKTNYNEDYKIIEKELKALEIIKHHLSEQVANIELGKPQRCLLMLIMENDKNYDLLKEVLL